MLALVLTRDLIVGSFMLVVELLMQTGMFPRTQTFSMREGMLLVQRVVNVAVTLVELIVLQMMSAVARCLVVTVARGRLDAEIEAVLRRRRRWQPESESAQTHRRYDRLIAHRNVLS